MALLLFGGLAQAVREAAVMKTDRQKITMAGWWAYMTRKERQTGDRKRGWAVCEQKGERGINKSGKKNVKRKSVYIKGV